MLSMGFDVNEGGRPHAPPRLPLEHPRADSRPPWPGLQTPIRPQTARLARVGAAASAVVLESARHRYLRARALWVGGASPEAVERMTGWTIQRLLTARRFDEQEAPLAEDDRVILECWLGVPLGGV